MPRTRPVESWESRFNAEIEYYMALDGIKTKTELARLMCVPQSTLSRHLKEPSLMSVGELRRMSKVLGMKAEDKGKLF